MENAFKSPIVFVLGAGFTKAFDDKAPTLFSDIGLKDIKDAYEKAGLHRLVNFINRLKIESDGSANIEELTSRLYSGMPFDDEVLYEEESRLLLRAVEEKFRDQLNKIKKLGDLDVTSRELLQRFSKFVIENNASVITFNYDCLLDEALFVHNPVYMLPTHASVGNYWSPDGCYGFLCKPASSCLSESSSTQDRTNTLLLKLHGSLNWRTRLGSKSPYSLDNLVHLSEWCDMSHIASMQNFSRLDIEPYLNRDPFMIPPVLDKSIMTKESILRLIWSLAFKKLNDANTVIFMGYSLPVTDIAVRFLFRESLNRKDRPKVVVVNIEGDEESKKRSYIDVLDTDLISDKSFDFSGVCAWIEANISNSESVGSINSTNASQSTLPSVTPNTTGK